MGSRGARAFPVQNRLKSGVSECRIVIVILRRDGPRAKPTKEDLKALIGKLVDESKDVRPRARGQPPEFSAWKLRAEMLADGIGGTFQVRMQRTLDFQAETYWSRLREANNRRTGSLTESVIHEWMVDAVLGLLQGLDAAIDDGLLTSIEDRVASDLYSSVLAEASVQQRAGRGGIAAILMRVALENGLRRLARRETMTDVDGTTASAVNNWLWKDGKTYPAGTHRAVEGWLAIGNAFVHQTSEAGSYTPSQIAKAIEDVQGFLGTHGL
jgi:hypothetical protein